MRALRPLLALLPALSPGCLTELWDDPIIYQALDTTIDEPKVLAVNVDPAIFLSGRESQVEALVVGPGGLEGTRASLAVCGLDQPERTALFTLDCFDDLDKVSTVAGGDLPLSWTPPDLAFECPDDPEQACDSYLPFILDSEVGGQPVRAAFNSTVLKEFSEEPWEVPSLKQDQLSLTLLGEAGGELVIEAALENEGPEATFRWYIADGELLDTGRTLGVTDGYGTIRSQNRWRLPDSGGALRLYVVVGTLDSSFLEFELIGATDTGYDADAPWAPNMVWARLDHPGATP